MRGRKPDPKAAAGALTRTPPAPKYLTPEARDEWRRAVPPMVAAGTLKPEDLALVENLCIARGRVREVEAEIRAAGAIDPKLWRVQHAAMQIATRLAAELYATPASRSRPSAQAPDEADDLDALGLAA